MVCLRGKVIVIVASQMFSLLLQLTFITKFHLTWNVSRTLLVSLQYYLLFLEHYKPFTPRHQYEYSPYCSQQISSCAGRENLFNNQEALQFIIIAFILVTLMFDSGVILKGEIRC